MSPHDAPSRDLFAITVMQPWAWAIAKGLKPYENRTWPTPRFLLGHYLAIHAGKRVDEDGVDAFRAIVRLPEVRPRLDAVHTGELTLRMLPLGAIVAVARVTGYVGPDGPHCVDPWFCGPYGWHLDDVQEIDPPVPCRGMQKVWVVPNDVAAVVRERWAAARGR